MRDQLDRFGDATVAVLTFVAPERLPAHRDQLDLGFPLLADPDRVVYRRFGLGRGPLHHIWSPGTLAHYARLLRRGRRLRRPTEDTRQLGGDFVIGADGDLVAEFRPRSPDERPSIAQLVDAVDRAWTGTR